MVRDLSSVHAFPAGVAVVLTGALVADVRVDLPADGSPAAPSDSPDAPDADSDGLSDEAETGTIAAVSAFEWHDSTGWREFDGRIASFSDAEPVTSEKKEIGADWWVVNPASLVIGERAFFRVSDATGRMPAGEVRWTIDGDAAHFVGGDTGWEVEVAATSAAEEVRIRATFGDCPTPGPVFIVNATAMRDIPLYPFILRTGTGETAWTEAQVAEQIATANRIFRQVGIRFVSQGIGYVDVTGAPGLDDPLDVSDRTEVLYSPDILGASA